MGFSEVAVRLRFDKQGEQCASCGKELVWKNRDRGDQGAWHAHHIDGNPDNNDISNCACLCINEPENCHLNVGHLGDSSSGKLAPISRFKLR